jgi:hypothetical protein
MIAFAKRAAAFENTLYEKGWLDVIIWASAVFWELEHENTVMLVFFSIGLGASIQRWLNRDNRSLV